MDLVAAATTVEVLMTSGIIGVDTPIVVSVITGLTALVVAIASSGVAWYQVRTTKLDKERADAIEAKADQAEHDASMVVIAQNVMKESIIHQRAEIADLRLWLL
jgi:hypothetical protein